MSDGDLDVLRRRLERERKIRHEAERIAEEGSRRLYQLNQVLEQRNAELARLSDVKSQFLANMSHEIRTPLNGVLGMLQLLARSPLDARQRQYAETARVAAESLLAIINDILDFSKIEAGKMEIELLPFELRELVSDVADLYS